MGSRTRRQRPRKRRKTKRIKQRKQKGGVTVYDKKGNKSNMRILPKKGNCCIQ